MRRLAQGVLVKVEHKLSQNLFDEWSFNGLWVVVFNRQLAALTLG